MKFTFLQGGFLCCQSFANRAPAFLQRIIAEIPTTDEKLQQVVAEMPAAFACSFITFVSVAI